MSIESVFVTLVLSVFVALFASILKRRSTDRLRLWLLGWFFVLIHFLLSSIGRHGTANLTAQTVRAIALLLGCVSFLLSTSCSHIRRRRTWWAAVAISFPSAYLCVLAIFGSTDFRWLLSAVAVGMTALARLMELRRPSTWRKVADLLIAFACLVAICVGISSGDRSVSVHALIATFIGYNAVAFCRRYAQMTTSVATVCLGFVIWSASIPLAIWEANLDIGTLPSAFFHIPKLFVAMGMMMTLLEEEIDHAKAAAIGEKRARMALAEEERKTRQLVDNAPVGIYRSTRGGQILFANPALLHMLGYTNLDELKSVNIEESALSNVPRTEFRRILESNGKVEGFESFCTRPDGSTILMRESACVVYCDAGDVLYYEGIVEDVTERQRLHDELLRRAYHDPLTGLANRELLEEHLQTAIARSDRVGSMTGLLCIDLDRFKQINDAYGHEIGDEFLIKVASRVGSRLRASDTFARIGGDEFMVVLADVGGTDAAEAVACDILKAMQPPFFIQDLEIRGAVSIGIAVYPIDARSPAELRRKSDQALYRAKQKGRHRFESAFALSEVSL